MKSVDIYFDLDEKTDAIIDGLVNGVTEVPSFFEGDTYNVNIYLVREIDGVREAVTLDEKQKLVIAGAVINDASSELSYVTYQDKFEFIYDDSNNPAYSCVLDFASQANIDLLSQVNNTFFTLELVIIDELFGYQQSFQSDAQITASVVKGAVRDISTPTINIGSYSSVVSLANGIVDQRILDLRAGAPVEFDTLYELAEFAQKVRSHEVVVGNYYDYLDGKRMADQNLTVVSLGNIAIDTSTYKVSHEPWRPIKVEVAVV
jgi:hypothetical protein